MLTLHPWAASLIAAIIAALSSLNGLLLCSSHMAVLAEAPQVILDVRAIGEYVVHLVGLVAAEYAESTVPFEDCVPDLLPVLR